MNWLGAAAVAKQLGTFAYNIFSNERHRGDVQSTNQVNWDRSQDLTAQTWERDDNAVQRRVADLRAAGMSPILAAGSPAGVSPPIKAEAQAEPTHQVQPADIMGVMLQAAQYDHTKADNARIRQQVLESKNRMQNENAINWEKLRELRHENDVRDARWQREQQRWMHEDAEEGRRVTQFARDGETWAIDLANRHQDLLTAELRTEREAFEYERLLKQGGNEVSNHIYNAVMNLLRANNRASDDWFERDLRDLSRIALHTRRPYENVTQAMERIARERRYHAQTIDHLRWVNRMAGSNE